ncbi:TetR/AcrR family transcriptional regulator [uncultured Roseibium sp.]|uniref:TetR/AcrR family transcriptional regulator n=1 Tax=uncultured Roseibium sp. TaxID=1936171 RepID=UPI002609F31E|nr:TetR/AcrR family transcriptional regulator [uncultured Roseibium sp.]
MKDTKARIAAGLERAFAENGFSEPNIDSLREAAGVSLRTLYKYMPSREEMVLSALEHRHRRYMQLVFDDLPSDGTPVLHAVLDCVAHWMSKEASHGCLFHAAVASAPRDERLRALLAKHKSEVAEKASEISGLQNRQGEIALIVEGLMQAWPLYGEAATRSAKKLCDTLVNDAPA